MNGWKVDHEKGEIRRVEYAPYPGQDEEGEGVFDNTHYEDKGRAIECLLANARARLSFCADRIKRATSELADANKDAGEATILASSIWGRYRRTT